MKVEKIDEKVHKSNRPVDIFTEEPQQITSPDDEILPDIFYLIGNNSDGEIMFNTLHLKNNPDTPLSLGKNTVISVEHIHEFDADVFKAPEDRKDGGKIRWALRNIKTNPELIQFYAIKEVVLTNTMKEMKEKVIKKLNLAEYMEETGQPWNIPFKVRTAFPGYESPVDGQLIAEKEQLETVGKQKRLVIDMSSEMDRTLEEDDEL